MKFTTLIIIFNLFTINSFSINNLPLKIVNPIKLSFSENNMLKTIDPPDNIVCNKSVVFFPALTTRPLPMELYNNFLNSISEKNIRIYVPSNDNLETLFSELKETGNNVTIVSHSNSAINAINYSNNYNFINNLVLIDPLDARTQSDKMAKEILEIEDINTINKNNNKKNKIELNNIENLIIINSQKSNEWRLLPLTFPIGFFSLKLSDLTIEKNISKDIIKVDLFGHFDILDFDWSNLMHNTFSKGFNDRDSIKLQQYHKWLANKVSSIIK